MYTEVTWKRMRLVRVYREEWRRHRTVPLAGQRWRERESRWWEKLLKQENPPHRSPVRQAFLKDESDYNTRYQTVDASDTEWGNTLEFGIFRGLSVNTERTTRFSWFLGNQMVQPSLASLQPTGWLALYPVRSGNGDIYRALSGNGNLCPERRGMPNITLNFREFSTSRRHRPPPCSRKCELWTTDLPILQT